MSRMYTLAGVGFFIGLLGLWGLFAACAPRGPADSALWFAFAVMGAIPVSATFALFGAVKSIQEEMRETRRELKHWKTLFQMTEDEEAPSTQFKSGTPPKRD